MHSVHVYNCLECGRKRDEHQVYTNSYGDLVCSVCEMDSLTYDSDRPATWWSIAVYETSRAYGGPEEGGWSYEEGHLTAKNKIRVFEDYAELKAYEKTLEETKLSDRENVLRIKVFKEKLPVKHYPANRPRYC